MWSIHPQDRNGDEYSGIYSASGRRFELLLNRPSTASFQLDLDDPDTTRAMLAPGEKEFTVRRNGESVETVFALAGGGVSVRGDQPTLVVGGLGIVSYLQDALVYGQTATFTGTSLPWTWINTFQSRTGGAYGITQGPVEGTAPTRYKTVQQDAELLQQIIDLSQSGAGFDFAIDPLRRYREWHNGRGTDNGLVLEWGVNVDGFDYEENAGPGQIVSDVRVVGPDGMAPRTATDATAQSLYGRREASLSYMSDLEGVTVTNQQLQAYADAAIDDFAAPLIIPNVTLKHDHPSVEWGKYALGDTVTFRAEIGEYTRINARYRIVGILVSVDDEERETIDLVLNLA